MKFVFDLFRWFFRGNKKNDSSFEPVLPSLEIKIPTEPQVAKKTTPYDIIKENAPRSILQDLKEIRPGSNQILTAKEELLHELQRLAPPKKRILDIFRRVA